jgi:Ca2+-binding RTX toxin-like protein
VTGGDGNDVIVAGIGVDNISGGNGDDSLYVDSSDTVSIRRRV